MTFTRKTAIILVEVPKPITQYGETDWQFLKRFDSHLHIPVYADCEADDRVLHFGMEKGVHIDAEMGLCHSRISRKYYETDSKKDNVTRKDYLYYKVGSDENGRIGDDIATESGSHVIYRKCIELYREQMQFTYHTGGCGNWYISYIDHDELTASGTVRLEAAKIYAYTYTPQEINMYRS